MELHGPYPSPKKTRHLYINDGLQNSGYCNNKVTNTKYTLLNFIPKNLMEQFGRFMNKYFLMVAFLQLWPDLTPVNPFSTWGPLLFMFTISSTKEGIDDHHRYIRDKLANEKLVWVIKCGVKCQVASQDIQIGDIVWLEENDEVPCDLVLLGTSEPLGSCFIETAALDGETDLKAKTAPAVCAGLNEESLLKVKGEVECPPPDCNTLRFDGSLLLSTAVGAAYPAAVTSDNVLLQTCVLRNTAWAAGVAVYTGGETKLGMSRSLPPVKLSAIDHTLDNLTIGIFVFQLVLVLVLGESGNAWRRTEQSKMWYLMYKPTAPWFEGLIIPLRFELLMSVMIPISLKVTMDLVKIFHSKFIDWDRHMFDAQSATPALASNTAIVEELGQINMILTDKTGTLTQNKMQLQSCCVNGTLYGSPSQAAPQDPALLEAVEAGDPYVLHFLSTLALCNTVIPARGEGGYLIYKAQSPDEEALARAAAQLHFSLVSKKGSSVVLIIRGQLFEYELLEVLKFTSERQRMSVIVREVSSGQAFLLCKGADEAILSRAVPGSEQQQWNLAAVAERYAVQGLRTLCIARRHLAVPELESWRVRYAQAAASVLDRERQVAMACEELEHSLEVLGVTAVEDQLQDEAPETIELLRRAGINFWMLTGDKCSTAIQVARSCDFILAEGEILKVEGRSPQDVHISLERALSTLRASTSSLKDMVVVIDGLTLHVALLEHRHLAIQLAKLADAAICCRVTPSQKAELAELMKACDFRVLAIGDGANDVRMIQLAHVGVGIAGQEGMQAARAADFSIGKFKFLQRLVLVHGRLSYHRSALAAHFCLYKSLLLAFVQLLFSFLSGVSGSSLLSSFTLLAFNVAYTSFPGILFTLDQNISEAAVFSNPQVMKICQNSKLLNLSTFAGSFMRALYHAIVAVGFAAGALGGPSVDQQEMGLGATSACVWLTTFTTALDSNNFTAYHHLVLWGTLGIFYIANFLVSMLPDGGIYGVMPRLIRNPSYWQMLLLAVVVGLGPSLVLKYLRSMYLPDTVSLLQREERLKAGSLAGPTDLPPIDTSSLSTLVWLKTALGIAPAVHQDSGGFWGDGHQAEIFDIAPRASSSGAVEQTIFEPLLRSSLEYSSLGGDEILLGSDAERTAKMRNYDDFKKNRNPT